MIRFLDHAWHLAHSYRLHALPATFAYYPVGTRQWDQDIRPQPPNFRGEVTEPNPNDYDVILSHLDNWVDRSLLRATPFRLMNLIGMEAGDDAVRITIMHGTPDNEQNRRNIVRLLDNAPGGPPFLVCNSRAAAEGWGLGPSRSRAIIHGYDTAEFWSYKERIKLAATVCSAGDMSRIYHGVPLLERVRQAVPVLWVGHNGDREYFPTYVEYRDFLASLLVYVHPGQASPMPGARTEAMLSGCCVVTTSNNDAAQYIEHGVTGFLCDEAGDMIETIRMLLADPARAYRVGKAGREAARHFFDKDRFVADWLDLLGGLGVRG